MKKYFIVENNQQAGPFAIDELRGKINPSSLVWFDGLANWEQAGAIGELTGLFVAPPTYPPNVPPPITHQQTYQSKVGNNYRPVPDLGNSGGGMIAIAYLLALLGGIGGIITGAILWMKNEKVDGKKYKKYTPASQMHGAFAFFTGIIVWAVCVEMFLKG